MKKHNILKVVLLSILIVVLCTWIFPSAAYQSQLEVSERMQLGIFGLFSYIPTLFRYFFYVLLTVLAIGMFYGVAYKIPAYRTTLDKIVKKFSGKETIFLVTIMLFITIIVSITGLSLGILFVFPFVISIILLMGYNKLVAATTTVGATIVGMLGSTLDTATTYYLHAILNIDIHNEMITKFILLAIAFVLLAYNVLSYAKKTKNNTDRIMELVPESKVAERKKVEVAKETSAIQKQASKKNTSSGNKSSEEKVVATKKSTSDSNSKKKEKTKTSTKKSTSKTSNKTSNKTKAYDLKSKNDLKVVVPNGKKEKIWPFVLIFDLIVIILAVSTFDWAGVLEIDFFTKALTAVQKFEIAGFPIFSKLLGEFGAFGSWSLYLEIPSLIVLATCFMGFIYGLKMDDFFDGILEGIKKAMKPAIYMFLLYLVLLIATFNPFQLYISKFLLELFKGFNVITMTLTAMVASVFNIELANVADSTLPYVTSVITDSTLYPLIGIIFQAVYGLVMLVAPTSAILIGTLSYLDISYGQWLKHIWKLFLELLVVIVIIFFIVFLI